jgi:hypothetical protein
MELFKTNSTNQSWVKMYQVKILLSPLLIRRGTKYSIRLWEYVYFFFVSDNDLLKLFTRNESLVVFTLLVLFVFYFEKRMTTSCTVQLSTPSIEYWYVLVWTYHCQFATIGPLDFLLSSKMSGSVNKCLNDDYDLRLLRIKGERIKFDHNNKKL